MAMRNTADSPSILTRAAPAPRRWSTLKKAVLKKAVLKKAVMAAALLAGCATAPAKPDDPTLRAANVPPGGHEVTCQYGELMAVQGTRDTNSDQTSLFAVLTFPEPNTPAPKRPFSAGVAVQRSRTDEPQAEADTRSSVICAPETQSHGTPSAAIPPG
jgi:hypothetical protein